MILLCSVALVTEPPYPSRVLLLRPHRYLGLQVAHKALGAVLLYLHQLAGEEEQGVQRAGEGCASPI